MDPVTDYHKLMDRLIREEGAFQAYIRDIERKLEHEHAEAFRYRKAIKEALFLIARNELTTCQRILRETLEYEPHATKSAESA